MARLAIIALIGAGVLGYMTYVEGTLAARSSSQPDVIALKQLIARGADGNAHVVVTDFLLCENFVHEHKNGSWTGVWIPIIPADEGNPADKASLSPRRVKALFFSTQIHNENELGSRLDKLRVQGLITNRITSLDAKVHNLLKQNYPDTDFDTCLIIQEGRTPMGMGIVLLLGAGSLLCVVIAIGLFLGAGLRRRA